MTAESRIESLERKLKADPASAAFASLAEEYRRAGRLGEAVEASRSGLERHPTYASARVTLARALQELGELDEARAEFETVLDFAPENLAAIRGLADIHRQRGDRTETLGYLKRALTLAPLDVELRDAIAEAEERMVVSPEPEQPESWAEADVSAEAPQGRPVDAPTAGPEATAAGVPDLVVLEGGEAVPGSPGFDEVNEAESGLGWEPTDWYADQVAEPVVPESPEPAEEPFPFASQPFASIGPPGPESGDDARSPDADERLDTLRRQEAALEHFLAEILKERDRRAG